MKKLSEIYKELGIAFTFPIEIEDGNGNPTYYENSDDYWYRNEYNKNGNLTYYENSNDYWYRYEYDENGKQTYFEYSNGGKIGTRSSSCDGKVIEIDGKKYKLTEL